MKFVSTHLGYAFQDVQLRKNVPGLMKYLAFLVALTVLYSVIFHVIMATVEDQEHSWLTGLYWTLTVMSTLGFGDITFQSDIGRAFSIVVLLSGIVFLLIVLPFAFIRYFYAPWLEAQLRVRAPTEVPEGTGGHVILAAWDSITSKLSSRLDAEGIPWFVMDEDGAAAAAKHGDGIPVVRGAVDDVETFRRLRADRARMVLLNRDDLVNTNMALTVREFSETVPVVAILEDEHAVDILELAGSNHAIPLKRRLGEQLANRVRAGHAEAHVIGRFQELVIAEFSVRETPLAGRTIAESRLREIAGVSVVGVWERGRMLPPRPELVLKAQSVPVVAGSTEAMERLNEYLYIYDTNRHPVVVIGGGMVGWAAARSLKDRGIPVHMVERDPAVAPTIGSVPDRLVIGDAANRAVMTSVGVESAPSIILTTNADDTNIYLAAYCRRLNPQAHIVSRITHDRNLASIQRAGADLTLSYAGLGVETVHALLSGRPPVIMGEGIDFHELPCPPTLVGVTLGDGQLGHRTGLAVVGVMTAGRLLTDPGPATRLAAGDTLLVIGTESGVAAFRDIYG
jgi:Trk K+ transport system NAD-binding subunit